MQDGALGALASLDALGSPGAAAAGSATHATTSPTTTKKHAAERESLLPMIDHHRTRSSHEEAHPDGAFALGESFQDLRALDDEATHVGIEIQHVDGAPDRLSTGMPLDLHVGVTWVDEDGEPMTSYRFRPATV